MTLSLYRLISLPSHSGIHKTILLLILLSASIWLYKITPPTPTYSLMLNGMHALHLVSSYKYLGILLISDISWSAHINSVCLKARRIVGLLYRQFSNSNASSHTIIPLYTSLVKLHLEYTCPVWSLHLAKDINALEKFNNLPVELHWELGTSAAGP